MFNGKTIERTEIEKEGRHIKLITFIFTDGTNLSIDVYGDDSLFFSTFDNESKRSSVIHANNIVG